MQKPKTIEKILYYIFLFLIPFQIRSAIIKGTTEWDSIFLYLTDILILAIFILYIKRTRTFSIKENKFLVLLIFIAALSIIPAQKESIALYGLIKLIEYIFIYYYTKKNIRELTPNAIFNILIFTGSIQAILAIAQFIEQKSIGIKFIEAGIYSPGEPGVATFIYQNIPILRSYGSFPHPNILAGFLILTIFLIYYQLQKKQSSILYIFLSLMIFALFTTFSRTAMAVFFVSSLIFLLLNLIKLRVFEHTEARIRAGKRIMNIFLILILSSLISILILSPYLKARFFNITPEEQAVDLRFFYNKMAVNMTKDNIITGVGIGSFAVHSQNYPAYLRAAAKMQDQEIKEIPQWLFQPVHNIYLLIASEIGIIGLIFFLLAIARKTKDLKNNIFNPIFYILISFLIIGLMDHYFWTLQSGAIMFWLTLALTEKHEIYS
ncbi:MAG: hypothetical protein GF387_00410 [Candidatus Portnoybacteria bacterium]|nr:hypothetical protein [Candidatus Portnoybacteria bacterium]